MIPFRLTILVTALMLLAGAVQSASQVSRLESFQLLDQHGRPSGIAPSKQATLVYFYRGDW